MLDIFFASAAVNSVLSVENFFAVLKVTAGFATCRVRYVRVRYMFSTA